MNDIIQLVRRYQRDENEAEREEAADDLLSEIYPSLTVFIRAHAAKDKVEDVDQEVLKDVFADLWLFEGETDEAFWAWFYRIARRRCADSFRGRKVTLSTVADPELLQTALSQLQDKALPPSELADVRAAINLLKVSDYPCLGWLWNRYVVGLSFVELGRQEGVTEEAARKRVQRCLESASKLMRK